jgi:uncharacterized protein YjbJ (UPF0337 family)
MVWNLGAPAPIEPAYSKNWVSSGFSDLFAPYARQEQFRPAFSSLIVEYWLIEGSASGRDTSQRGSCLTATAQGARISRWISVFQTSHRTEKGITMKLSTSDKTAGKVHEVKGAIKQKAGELTGNRNLESNGRIEKNAGKVQNFAGKVEKSIGE